MKTKSTTFAFGDKALTVTLWEDLGLCKATSRFTVLLGWEVSKNYRLSAMERCDTVLVAIGPLGITYSKVYLRGVDE